MVAPYSSLDYCDQTKATIMYLRHLGGNGTFLFVGRNDGTCLYRVCSAGLYQYRGVALFFELSYEVEAGTSRLER